MITSVEGRPLGDEELVDLARRGDADAYVQLVERYQRLAQRVAFVITRSTADAEDAAQEAFVKAYYALSRFRGGAPFKPWLLRIVTNEALNRVRAATRRAQLALRVERLSHSGDAAPSPEAAGASPSRRRASTPTRAHFMLGWSGPWSWVAKRRLRANAGTVVAANSTGSGAPGGATSAEAGESVSARSWLPEAVLALVLLTALTGGVTLVGRRRATRQRAIRSAI